MRQLVSAAAWHAVAFWVAASPVAAAPEIRSVRPLTPRVQRYGCFEMGAKITGNWSNPFDPDQIDVTAEVTAPSGKRLRAPAFWHQEYSERPRAKARGQMDLVTLFLYDRDWTRGTRAEFYLDDVSLIDGQGREVPFDDMEQGDAPRATANSAPPLQWATEIVHGGRRSIRFTPEIQDATRWPSVHYSLGSADWSRHRGMVLWVYPRCDSPLEPLRAYFIDKEWGKSRMVTWEPRNGTLRANRWNRLVWRFTDAWPPVKLVPKGRPEWRVRFTPVEVGRYRVRLSARDQGGTATAAAFEFAVAPSKLHGFVRVSKRDPHYFAFDDGTPSPSGTTCRSACPTCAPASRR